MCCSPSHKRSAYHRYLVKIFADIRQDIRSKPLPRAACSRYTWDKLNSPMVSTFCRLIVIVTTLSASYAVAQTAAKPTLNVVLITIDTLRVDHLGCYGYKRIKTPNIDGLPADGARFESAFAVVPVTLPSHSSMLTGTDPMLTGRHDSSGKKPSPVHP